jgi:membrane-associated phospholipid phosphatase
VTLRGIQRFVKSWGIQGSGFTPRRSALTLLPPSPTAVRRGGTAAKWLLAGLLLLLAALALTVVAAGEGVVPGDIAVARAVQRPASAEIDAVARFVSLVGDDFPAMVGLGLVGVVMLIAVGRGDLAVFLGVAAALRAVGPGLKTLIASPRPTLELVAIVVQAEGLGFPSGHAMGAALFYGAIVVIVQQVVANRLVARAIQVAAVVMMVLIAISRVRLGVHWPSDVVGGLLFGLATVCLMQSAFLGWKRVRLRR